MINLQQKYGFELISLPLTAHGNLLDALFRYLKSDYIYLVDSDVEILSDTAQVFLKEVRERMEVKREHVFGYGFVQCSGFGLPPMERYFHKERMWIPLTCLYRPLIQKALDAGISFNITSRANFYGTTSAKLFVKIRNKFTKWGRAWFARLADDCLQPLRKAYKKQRIDACHYDTGALVYETLQQMGYHFVGEHFYAFPNVCNHYCGITRNKLYENEPVSQSESAIEREIKNSLLTKYSFDFESFYK